MEVDCGQISMFFACRCRLRPCNTLAGVYKAASHRGLNPVPRFRSHPAEWDCNT